MSPWHRRIAWVVGIAAIGLLATMISLLFRPDGKTPDSSASPTPDFQSAGGPPSVYCVDCHSQKRILRAKKTAEEWRKTVTRMQAHSREMADKKPISNENAEKVLQFLTKYPP